MMKNFATLNGPKMAAEEKKCYFLVFAFFQTLWNTEEKLYILDFSWSWKKGRYFLFENLYQ